jgi:hypothetical protein
VALLSGGCVYGDGVPEGLELGDEPAGLALMTLVVGRNGSGKSSFAEAIEVLLTGNLRR